MPHHPSDLKDLYKRLTEAYPDAHCMLDHATPFQLLVATMLSAQCTDKQVNKTTPKLFKQFPTARKLSRASLEEVRDLIRSIGFYKTKSRHLIGMAQQLMSEFKGKVPPLVEALVSLPGVGKKTANVVLSNAFGVPALAVDTHVKRLAQRLGLSRHRDPLKVEKDLCRVFPKPLWNNLHHLLITHGRMICQARNPKCSECPVQSLCSVGLGLRKDPYTGKKIVPTTKMSLVSLVPSMTELLFLWNLGDQVIGRTQYCDAPPRTKKIISVGGTKNPNIKLIESLKPSLVLMEKSENTLATAEALTQYEIPWIAVDIHSVSSCCEALKQLGEKLHKVSEAKKMIRAILKVQPLSVTKKLKVLTLVWKKPWIVAGRKSYCGDLVGLGHHRILDGDSSRPYPRLTEEVFKKMKPDIVLLPDEPYPFTAVHRKELKQYFPKAQVVLIDGKLLTWYLSRTKAGIEMLRALLG